MANGWTHKQPALQQYEITRWRSWLACLYHTMDQTALIQDERAVRNICGRCGNSTGRQQFNIAERGHSCAVD